MLEFFLKMLEFFPQSQVFFQSTGVLKIKSQIYEKMAVGCGKFVQKVPYVAFFRRALRKYDEF